MVVNREFVLYTVASKLRGKMVFVQAQDGTGQDRFGNMTRVYYKDAHAALIVYDSTREATFEGALRWKADLDNKVLLASGKPVPAVLLSNKCDLDSLVSAKSVEKLAEENGFLKGMDVSAKDNIGIDEAFQFLTDQVVATERDGQYEIPLYQRDGNVRRLTNPSNMSGRNGPQEKQDSCSC
ncbi:hypothetical protein L596_019862 [Steinernema carpocapsae]|uniref:Ras-related protein Rab n=1 Tax=Steinernema carpocapsae TaxID=34508 RepID=A0A4V6A0R2_STECR|nr:hypothetical protein L596_019862 [Steinernema carpocapsae]